MSQEIETTNNGAPLTLSGGAGQMATSFDLNSDEGKILALQANQENEPLRDHVGETVRVKDVIMQNVEIADEDTGEVTPGVRCVIVAENGDAYSATSKGIVNALHQVFSIMGEPQTWKKPIPMKVVEKSSRTNSMYRFLSLVPVLDAKSGK